MEKRNPSKSFLGFRQALLFLLVVASANGLLSYSSLPIAWKYWIFLAGILFPCLLGVSSALKARPTPWFDNVSFTIPAWLWIALAVLALFLRLFRLTDLAAWPLHDEAMHSYYGLELAQGQKPRFFYTFSQFPPFYIWGLGLFFKFVEPSLFSLWLYPALVSIATVGLAYGAARLLFPARSAFVFFLFSAFSFWPLLQGRFSHAGVLVLFWEYLALLTAGIFWKARGAGGQKGGLVLFGAATGLGFYVFTSWFFVALAFTGLACLLCRSRRIPLGGAAWFFLAPLALLSLPYFFFLATNGPLAHYIGSILVPPRSLSGGWDQALTSLTYFSNLWWGGLKGGCYVPNWGGFLNPLLDAFFFLGLIRLFQSWKSPWVRWGVFAFFLMMLPGVLTANVECFRIIQVFPVLLTAVVLGLESFLRGFKKHFQPLALALVFAASLGLDANHLFGICPKAWTSGGEKTYAEQGLRFYPFGTAYHLLKETADQWGPGLILTNLVSPPDPSLIVSTFPFNTTLNPRLAHIRPQWGALLVNENDYPFLKARFPKARFALLPPSLENSDGAWMLVVLPLDPSVGPIFSRLTAANQAMTGITAKTMHLTFQENHQGIRQALLGLYPYFKGDPLLESLFWEALYLHASASDDFATSLLALLQARKTGYATAAVYNELGYMRVLQGRLQDARLDYEKALRCPWNHTSAAQNLERIDRQLRSLK